MKKILFILLPLMLLSSCDKDYLVTAAEIPGWLKDRIAWTEKQIMEDDKSGLEMTAWIRYTYKGDFYYEWINMLSSYWPHLYNREGELMTFSTINIENYWEEKCCKTFIWKGPDYSDGIEN